MLLNYLKRIKIKIDWFKLSMNNSIFQIDYDNMKKNNQRSNETFKGI